MKTTCTTSGWVFQAETRAEEAAIRAFRDLHADIDLNAAVSGASTRLPTGPQPINPSGGLNSPKPSLRTGQQLEGSATAQ